MGVLSYFDLLNSRSTMRLPKNECFSHQRVLDMMMRKKREAADSENQVPPQIDTLLLIDRNVDLLTPLFTQLTYEGLIDELYGIHHSKCYVK